MAIVDAWIAFPLVLAALSLGLGLLVECVSGAQLPTVLLLPVGSAALIALTSLTVAVYPSPAVITALAVALAAFGIALRGLRRIDASALVAAVAVFLCYGAPVLASGVPTFAGYIKLDDTATFLALVDRAFDHGRSLAGLQPSSYEATLAVNLVHGYPLGSVLPLGVGHELVRQDVAWLYQPWLSWNAAMLALCLFRLATPLVRRRSLSAVVAFAAAQSALLYGFALWGGVKELVAAALVATAVAVAAGLKPPYRLSVLVPFALVAAALVDAASLAAAVWLLPAAAILVRVIRVRPATAAPALATAAVLTLPAAAAASAFYRGSNRAVFTDATELGNLVRPLHVVQVLGIWPSGDFRLDPHSRPAAILLLALATALAALGIAVAVKRRAPGVLLGVASAVVGAFVFVTFAAPWVAGKALAIGSPLILLAAAVGAVSLLTQRAWPARLLALGAFVALVGGVAWSNVLAYHDVSLAPYSQLRELQRIGDRFAGDGPALMSEYQPYGVRHFLRRLDAEGVSELRRRPIALRNGTVALKEEYVDIDQIRVKDLLVYRTLVLRKSPTESRPPGPYRLVWDGRWYSVWQREKSGLIVVHRPLGDSLEPGGTASCRIVRRLATSGRLISVPRSVNLVWSLDQRALPHGWLDPGGGSVLPNRSGMTTLALAVPRRSRYRIWIGGSIRGRLSVTVDGTQIGSIGQQLQNAGQWLELGSATLSRGTHRVKITVSLPRLDPGTGGGLFPLGPLLLEPVASDQLLQPAKPQAICGRNLDWIETRKPLNG